MFDQGDYNYDGENQQRGGYGGDQEGGQPQGGGYRGGRGRGGYRGRGGGRGGGGRGGGGGAGNFQQREHGPSVFVGNIPWAAQEEELARIFSEFGNVARFRILQDRNTGRPRGKEI